MRFGLPAAGERDERGVGSEVRERVDADDEGLDASSRSGTRADSPPGV
jgi:hypothetical protein